MPLPSLYVNPEDRIDSNEMAKQLAEEIKQFQAEQQQVGGGGGAAAVQVEVDAPEADKVDGEDASSSLQILDAIREATQTTANFVKGMASQVHSMHFDALKQRKNADNHKLLQEIADNTKSVAERVPGTTEDDNDAEKEEEETTGGVGAPEDNKDPNDAAQENNDKVQISLTAIGNHT